MRGMLPIAASRLESWLYYESLFLDLTAAAKHGINPKKATHPKRERRRGMSSGPAASRERTAGEKFVCRWVVKKVPKPREEIVRAFVAWAADESRPLPEAPVNGQECSLAHMDSESR